MSESPETVALIVLEVADDPDAARNEEPKNSMELDALAYLSRCTHYDLLFKASSETWTALLNTPQGAEVKYSANVPGLNEGSFILLWFDSACDLEGSKI